MKHIIKIFLATIIVFSLNSCEDSDQVIDQVVADTEAGAILRTISDDSNSNVLNSSNPASFWSQVVEAQDDEATGFCRVRSSVLRLARAGSERSPGGGPDRWKPNAGPTGCRKVMPGRGESRRMDRILRDRSPRWISIHVRGPKRGKPCAGSRARPGGQTDVGFFGGTRSEAGR